MNKKHCSTYSDKEFQVPKTHVPKFWALRTCSIANTHIWRNNNSWASSCHIKVWFKKSRFLLETISWYIINIKNFKGRVLYLVFVKDYLWCSFCFEIWEFGKSLKKEHVFFPFQTETMSLSSFIYIHIFDREPSKRLHSSAERSN